MDNALMTEGVEAELVPEIEQPTGTEPEPPVNTEPPATTTEPEPLVLTGTESQAPEGEVDEEPMTTAQMREHMKKLESQVNSLHRRLAKKPAQRPPTAPPPLDETKAPKIEQFSTIEEFETAKRNWEIDQRVTEGIRKATAGDPQEVLKAERSAFVTETVEQGKSLYQDFEKVVLSATVPITNEIIDAVREMDSEHVTPEDVFYYLGKNPSEAAAISRMSQVGVVRALTRIETRLEAAKANAPPPKRTKTVTGAPPPIKPTDSTVVIHKDPDKMSQTEYEQWRSGQKKG